MAARTQDILGAAVLETADTVQVAPSFLLGQSDLFDGMLQSSRVEPVVVREIRLAWFPGTHTRRIQGVRQHWRSYSGRRGRAFTFTPPGFSSSVLAVYGERSPRFQLRAGSGSASVTVLTVFSTQE